MLNASRKTLFIVAMLLCSEGFADDAKSFRADGEPTPNSMLAIAALFAESAYLVHSQPYSDSEVLAYSDDWLPQISTINLVFQDANAFTRVSQVRTVSLLTLKDSGRARLFLGVNEEGFVGLHYRATSSYPDGRNLELARLPYLKKSALDGQRP